MHPQLSLLSTNDCCKFLNSSTNVKYHKFPVFSYFDVYDISTGDNNKSFIFKQMSILYTVFLQA